MTLEIQLRMSDTRRAIEGISLQTSSMTTDQAESKCRACPVPGRYLTSSWYHLVHKDMRQPRLMKLSRTNGDGNRLSSDVVSIASAYFLSSLYLSLKYAIQFLLI
jgi:hypothetical protein